MTNTTTNFYLWGLIPMYHSGALLLSLVTSLALVVCMVVETMTVLTYHNEMARLISGLIRPAIFETGTQDVFPNLRWICLGVDTLAALVLVLLMRYLGKKRGMEHAQAFAVPLMAGTWLRGVVRVLWGDDDDDAISRNSNCLAATELEDHQCANNHETTTTIITLYQVLSSRSSWWEIVLSQLPMIIFWTCVVHSMFPATLVSLTGNNEPQPKKVNTKSIHNYQHYFVTGFIVAMVWIIQLLWIPQQEQHFGWAYIESICIVLFSASQLCNDPNNQDVINIAFSFLVLVPISGLIWMELLLASSSSRSSTAALVHDGGMWICVITWYLVCYQYVLSNSIATPAPSPKRVTFAKRRYLTSSTKSSATYKNGTATESAKQP